MNKSDENLVKLLQLKKQETPGEEYFNHFLSEFHSYQRSEYVPKPSFWNQIITTCSDFLTFQPQMNWVNASSLAMLVALLTIGTLHWQQDEPTSSAPAVASHLTDQMTLNQNQMPGVYQDAASQQVEIQNASLNPFEKDFQGSRFVSAGHSNLSYETSLAF